jgi:hypothetical protein
MRVCIPDRPALRAVIAPMPGFKAVWLLMVFSLLGLACSSDSGPPIVQPPRVTTANISGMVTDGDGPVPGVTVMLDDGETTFAATTVTTGTYRLQVEPGSYDVKVGVAPPARGEALQLMRVSFATAGDHRLDLPLSSGRLNVSAPSEMEGESVEVGLLWKNSPIASHHGPVVEGRAQIEFRALLPVAVLVAVYLPGETTPRFPPGVSSPVSESYWNLLPSATVESSFTVP